MKDPFKHFTIAVTGDFGERRGHDKMKQWIQFNGGKFTHEINVNVTHLICSKDHYKIGVAMVEQARAQKTIKIVSFDWLEDCLMKMRPLSDRNYLMNPRMRTAAKAKAKKKYIRKDNVKKGMVKFEKDCKEFVQDMNTDGYEIYRHPHDTFAHDITLARANLLANKNQRYQLKTSYPYFINPTPPIISTPLFPMSPLPSAARACLVSPRAQRLQLYVSHSTPKMFACYVKYSAPNENATTQVLAPRGSSWDTAWSAFRAFFKLKTGKDWSMRHVKWKPIEDGFVYTPPRQGEPQGRFPTEVYHRGVL